MTPAIEIVPPEQAELQQLFALAKGTFSAFEGWSDRRVLGVLAGDVVFVAREAGHAAGYVALRPEKEAMLIEQLFVAPGHERRGVGHRLLDFAEGYAIAQHAQTLRIVVERDNDPARSFYRRSGFVPVGDELFERVLPLS